MWFKRNEIIRRIKEYKKTKPLDSVSLKVISEFTPTGKEIMTDLYENATAYFYSITFNEKDEVVLNPTKPPLEQINKENVLRVDNIAYETYDYCLKHLIGFKFYINDSDETDRVRRNKQWM